MPHNEFSLNDISPVILAGGKGTRLRPLTNSENPKPFLKLFSEYSLFQETLRRGRKMAMPVVVTHHLYAQRVYEEMKEMGVRGKIIEEPEGKSTAPAIALAAFELQKNDKPMLVMPSDHYIPDFDRFSASIELALKAFDDSDVVMLGAQAKKPETRFGYIRADHAGRVDGFIEKPSLNHAKLLLKSGLCYWNTGIFLVRPSVYLSALKEFAPDIYEATQNAHVSGHSHASFIHPNAAIYSENRLAAVDRAIMENIVRFSSDNNYAAVVVPLLTAWQDVGSWGSLLGAKLKLIKNKNTHDKRHILSRRS